ncbi:MAG: rhodanese-like domain-containing protein [Hyphomonadaceae bacterium]|nr:rhodanese-like domain-containing protein [Hyphomonadaceae bacterium]
MTARRNTILALLALAAFIFAGASAAQPAELKPAPTTEATIDYPGFLEVSAEVMEVRAQRLVSLESFNEMAGEPNTIILDTRSAEAFAMGHIDGAVHLNFSDFTDEKLAAVVGDKGTRILIYCNNNFSDDVAPIVLKRAPLALNIPTFVNLYGYGYENVYELADLVSTQDPDVHWVSALS